MAIPVIKGVRNICINNLKRSKLKLKDSQVLFTQPLLKHIFQETTELSKLQPLTNLDKTSPRCSTLNFWMSTIKSN